MSSEIMPITQEFLIVSHLHKSAQSVLLVESKLVGKLYAMKTYPFKNLMINPSYINESRFHWISHQHVISIRKRKPKNIDQKDRVSQFSYILMEVAPYGNFADLITRSKLPDDEKLMRTYFHQFIDGLEYLHSNGITHMDLKLSNLLLGEVYLLKICDFDCARTDEDGLVLSKGTQNFRAPELRIGECYDKKACDIYSAGIILFCFIARRLPYFEERLINGHDLEDLMRNDQESFWNFHRDVNFNKGLKALFLSMTDLIPSNRPTIEEIKKNDWFQRAIYSEETLYSIMKNNSQLPCVIKYK